MLVAVILHEAKRVRVAAHEAAFPSFTVKVTDEEMSVLNRAYAADTITLLPNGMPGPSEVVVEIEAATIAGNVTSL